MEGNNICNNQMNKRRPKEEHIDELNGMTMEGKENEGKRKLMRNGV